MSDPLLPVRIVVLDGATLNPGDLSWDPLNSLGACEVFQRTAAGEVVSRATGATVLLTNKVRLPADLIAQLPALRYIGVTATGYDVVDVQAARQHGVSVTNVPIYGTRSVAQMVFAHLLNLTQRVAEHSQAVAAGRWSAAVDWCFWDFPLCELEGATMGIVGYGRIGRATAQLAQAFGMRVVAHTPHPPAHAGEVRFVDLEHLLAESDVVSLHCPLTTENAGMINAPRLALMKPSAFLINTGRGGLVDEHALAAALNADQLAGAGLDVLSREPPAADNPLLKAKNCYITPHIAWATRESRQRLLDTSIENVACFVRGAPRNVVN
jgi:glycerate dehydrogenase